MRLARHVMYLHLYVLIIFECVVYVCPPQNNREKKVVNDGNGGAVTEIVRGLQESREKQKSSRNKNFYFHSIYC